MKGGWKRIIFSRNRGASKIELKKRLAFKAIVVIKFLRTCCQWNLIVETISLDVWNRFKSSSSFFRKLFQSTSKCLNFFNTFSFLILINQHLFALFPFPLLRPSLVHKHPFTYVIVEQRKKSKKAFRRKPHGEKKAHKSIPFCGK